MQSPAFELIVGENGTCSQMDLYSAGHRRGVVAAPHHAAAETGRRDPRRRRQRARGDGRDGGDDRGGLSAHEPHRRRRLLAGARALGPRACLDGRGAGRREGDAGALSRARARRRSRRAVRSPRSPFRRRSRPGCWRSKAPRRIAAGCRSTCCSAPRSSMRAGLHGDAQPGAAHRREACRMQGRAGLRGDVPGRRQAARRRRDAQADRACRDARSTRQCGARRTSIAAMSGARSRPIWSASARR